MLRCRAARRLRALRLARPALRFGGMRGGRAYAWPALAGAAAPVSRDSRPHSRMNVPHAAVLDAVSSSAAMPCRRFTHGMGRPARGRGAAVGPGCATIPAWRAGQQRTLRSQSGFADGRRCTAWPCPRQCLSTADPLGLPAGSVTSGECVSCTHEREGGSAGALTGRVTARAG